MTKIESKRQYGIALLMMLFLHLFRTSLPIENLSLLNTIFQANALAVLSNYTGICIACYAFITGYGFLEQIGNIFNSDKEGSVASVCKYIVRHILKLYQKYWLVFCIFIPLGYLNGSYQEFSVKQFVLSLIGLDNSYNGAWWYVWQYVILCTALPMELVFFDVLKKSISKRSLTISKDGITIFVLSGLVTFLLWALDGFKLQKVIYSIICLLGYTSAEYKILVKGRELIKKIPNSGIVNGVIFIVLIAIRIYQRIRWGGANGKIDILIIIPYFIVVCGLLEKSAFLWRPLEFFGKYSTYMWLIHNFFLVTKIENLFVSQI